MSQSENSRLAKNSLFLYLRMLLSLLIGLYTSRVTLNVLGVSDYGIHNVVGGIVGIFASLNGAMASTSSRYITYYLGQGNENKLCSIFSTITYIHFFIGVLVIFASEMFGVWFFYNKLQIPEERLDVAFWLLQFSFASSFLHIINTPYTGLIVAHEKMNVYAYVSIFDVTMKLIIVLLLQVVSIDKLLFVGSAGFAVGLIDWIIYRYYSIKHFKEARLHRVFDISLLKELGNYFGWSIFGNLALFFNGEGINLLLNVFFGPAVNAARGIAVSVQNIVVQFVSNFQIAVNPQIVKSYASSNMERMHRLMFISSKFGFFLLFLTSFPVMLEGERMLHLWLGMVPDHTVNFVRIILIACLIDTLSNPAVIAAGATGKIRNYTIVVAGIVLLPLPVSWVLLHIVKKPEIVFAVLVAFFGVALVARLFFMRKMIGLSLRRYFTCVLYPILKVVIVSILVPLYVFLNFPSTLLSFIFIIIISVISVGLCIWLLGLSSTERAFVTEMIRSKMSSSFKCLWKSYVK